jgi:hypothetical protein
MSFSLEELREKKHLEKLYCHFKNSSTHKKSYTNIKNKDKKVSFYDSVGINYRSESSVSHLSRSSSLSPKYLTNFIPGKNFNPGLITHSRSASPFLNELSTFTRSKSPLLIPSFQSPNFSSFIQQNKRSPMRISSNKSSSSFSFPFQQLLTLSSSINNCFSQLFFFFLF